jgi:hypothetical protein
MGMSLVNFLANEKEIPTENITRLILLQKIFPKLCISRGLIYEYASQWEKSHYFPNDYVSDKIAVENAFGLGDINYMSELIFTFDYLRFLQKNLPRLQIKHALSLHTTNKTSIDGIESYKQTNQYNCDLKLILLDINTQNILTIYLDIKQTEGSSLDYQSKYLKLLYKNNPNSIENYLEYVNDTYFDTFSKKMPFNYLIDKNIDIFQRLNSLHEWLLINSKENNINCTLVYTKKINEEIILNEDDDYNQINKDMFLSNQAFNTSMNRLMNAERKVSLANIQEKLTNHKALIENIGQTRSKYFPEFAKDDYHDLPH